MTPTAAVRSVLAAVTLALLSAGPAVAFGEKAKGELKDASGKLVGSVEVVEVSGGSLITIVVDGLAPGSHAVGIHDTSTCEGDFSGAGGRYNPLGARHGFLDEEGPMAGDLPNIHVGADGKVRVEFLNHFISIGKDAQEPLLDADGASLVVFEKADDYLSEPDTVTGARIACAPLAPVEK
ncbi:MAG: superoxide dismutase family protein [Hyphomicrobium sp.]